jgi:cytidine deaminase
MTELTAAEQETLIQAAMKARARAYAPYSQYQVGAALLASKGQVFTGCNVENASYGATICAERTAVVKAVSEGVLDFSAIVVCTENGGAPCGICRQVLYEFNPAMQVFIINAAGALLRQYRLHDLLPDGFGPTNLPTGGR